jgi:hypothetical protein
MGRYRHWAGMDHHRLWTGTSEQVARDNVSFSGAEQLKPAELIKVRLRYGDQKTKKGYRPKSVTL